MRATRAYLAGIGTAGALALGAALVFAAASALIAFRGWPGTVGSGGPARQVLTVTPPPSPVARRVAHIATTTQRTATTRHQVATLGRTTGHGAAGTARGHHRTQSTAHTQHQATTTPGGTATHPTQPTKPARHTTRHAHRGGPLHSKSYPVNTATNGQATTASTPVTTAPTITTAVTTAPTSTSTSTTPVGVKVSIGHGHTVTISTVAEPTTPPTTVPTTIRPITTTSSPTTTTVTSTAPSRPHPGEWTVTSSTPSSTTTTTSTTSTTN